MIVERIFISSGHSYFGRHGQSPANHAITEVESVECVAGRGLRGDRFFGYRPDYRGQVTFFSAEVFDELCAAFPGRPLKAAALRRNVLVRGVNLNALIGTSFELGGVSFAGVEECRPCYWMNTALCPGAEDWLRGRGGLRTRILSDGWLQRSPALVVGRGLRTPPESNQRGTETPPYSAAVQNPDQSEAA